MSIPNLLSIQIGKFRLSILEVIKGRMGIYVPTPNKLLVGIVELSLEK